MILYLVRHGIAEDSAPGGEADRKLTQEGTLRTAMVAKGLKRLDVEPGRIVSSPYVRALQTAEIIARILHHTQDLHLDKRLTPMSRFQDLCDLIKENDDVESLMVTGHEPSMGEFISGLCADGQLRIEVKKASVTAIELTRLRPQPGGHLLWSLPPKIFEKLAE